MAEKNGPTISPIIEWILNVGLKKAKDKKQEFFTVEHLTLELLDSPEVIDFLKSILNIDLNLLKQKLIYIINQTPLITEKSRNKETQPTLSVQRILQKASNDVEREQRSQIEPLDVLRAILKEKIGDSVSCLKSAGVTLDEVENYLKSKRESASSTSKSKIQAEQPQIIGIQLLDSTMTQEADQLGDYLRDLNAEARAGKLSPVVGRDREILETIQVLSRRQKNNPLLVGEAGVGKTAIVEGLAQQIVKGKVPTVLRKNRIFSLNLGALLAGTRYRGDFEKRIQSVLDFLKGTPGAILFIDEIHTIIGAGAVTGTTVDLSNLLKPVLTTGEFKCIGATTYQEYRRYFEKDPAITRRFQTVDIPEPSPEEAFLILKGIKKKFEDHYHVSYDDDALQSAVELSVRYIPNRFLPDKAIDVMDEAGSMYVLLPTEMRSSTIDKKMIERTLAKMARIPEIEISRTTPEILKHLDADMKRVIFGQDEAIQALVDAVKLVSTGLEISNKPIGSFLFMGPTGVGKTEVARQLAHFMGIKLIRFDMSEYKEAHTISRLIGAPPGYVGHEQGGLLTEEITKNPHCVLLLDEIEKAHPDIYNLLLQIMDYGTLTDSLGRKTDFRHTILIMTSNVGADRFQHPTIGFATSESTFSGLEDLARIFTPEFRNRIDAIIPFHPLDHNVVTKIAGKMLLELKDQLEKKKVTLTFDQKTIDWVAEQGYSPTMGARPLTRLIKESLTKALVDELLFGHLVNGGSVSVTVTDHHLTIKLQNQEGQAKEIVL